MLGSANMYSDSCLTGRLITEACPWGLHPLGAAAVVWATASCGAAVIVVDDRPKLEKKKM